MKKGLIIGLAVALVLGLATVGMAGNIQFGGDATTAIDLSSTGSGTFNWWAEGRDSNNYMGARHGFSASGSYDVDASISVGYYGWLDTIVKADSTSAASFNLYGWQDFDVTNGHAPSTPYNRVGELDAYVSGSTSAHMDMKLNGDMYLFNDHGPYTYPTTANPNWMLKGEGDYEVSHFVGMWNKTTASYDADSYIELSGTGDGEFGFSSAWAFHTYNSGTISYPSGTMYAQASGSGTYYQDAFGSSYLNFNGFEATNGGFAIINYSFNDGFEGNPSVQAN